MKQLIAASAITVLTCLATQAFGCSSECQESQPLPKFDHECTVTAAGEGKDPKTHSITVWTTSKGACFDLAEKGNTPESDLNSFFVTALKGETPVFVQARDEKDMKTKTCSNIGGFRLCD